MARTMGRSTPFSTAQAWTASVVGNLSTVRPKRLAAHDSLAHPTVPGVAAGGGDYQVAEPVEPVKGLPLRALGDTEADDLGLATGEERGLGVVAEGEPIGHSRRQGHHLLERPSKLDPRHVVRGVETVGGPVQGPLHPQCQITPSLLTASAVPQPPSPSTATFTGYFNRYSSSKASYQAPAIKNSVPNRRVTDSRLTP